MKTLDEIGLEQATDKSSSHHHYLPLYDLLFRRWLDHQIRILEIGVQFGNSINTWKEYFPAAQIDGIDCVDHGHGEIVGDAYTNEMVSSLPYRYDIIIDDGSHNASDQAFVVARYSALLIDEGVLIVEDVCEKETIQTLVSALPSGFSYSAVDMTEGNAGCASRLFICWRNE